MKIIKTIHYKSTVGELIIGSFEDRLCMCDWLYGKKHEQNLKRLSCLLDAGFEGGISEVTERALSQLDDYFNGDLRSFDIPLLFAGSDFQRSVWSALLDIPFGQTISYGDIAARIGRSRSVRAVANAIGYNPISIIVPCHRIIGVNKSLTGYNGGIYVKKSLLEFEALR